jgi:hypothetical protein
MYFRAGLLPILAIALLTAGCSPGGENAAETGGAPQTPPSTADTLHVLFEDEWQVRLERDPLFASEMGVERYNDALPIDTAEDHVPQEALKEQLILIPDLVFQI